MKLNIKKIKNNMIKTGNNPPQNLFKMMLFKKRQVRKTRKMPYCMHRPLEANGALLQDLLTRIGDLTSGQALHAAEMRLVRSQLKKTAKDATKAAAAKWKQHCGDGHLGRVL